MNTLTRSELKALAYHRVVADKLRADPTLLDVARDRLRWYRERNPSGASYYDAWQTLLSGPMNRLVEVITSPDAEACALRQENPFVDLITQPERARIYRSVVEAIEASSK